MTDRTPPATPESDTAWLIERGQPEGEDPPVWWTGKNWDRDANNALRFPDKTEAISYINQHSPTLAYPHQFGRAVEHGFIAAAPRSEPGGPAEPAVAAAQHSHLWFCSGGCDSLPIHDCGQAADRAAPADRQAVLEEVWEAWKAALESDHSATPSARLARVLNGLELGRAAPEVRETDFDLLLRRAYANGHRDGMECGGPLAASECEHVGAAGSVGAAPAEPPTGTRLVLVTGDLFEFIGTRDSQGRRLSYEWGEPDEHGWYTPTITAHDDDRLGAAPRSVEAGLPAEETSGMECPMCGGSGRIHDITAAIEEAQVAGTVLVPLSAAEGTATP